MAMQAASPNDSVASATSTVTMSVSPASLAPMQGNMSDSGPPAAGSPVAPTSIGTNPQAEGEVDQVSDGALEPGGKVMTTGDDGVSPPTDGTGASAQPTSEVPITPDGIDSGNSGDSATLDQLLLATDAEGEVTGEGDAVQAGDPVVSPAAPVYTTPRSPEEDPNFQAIVARTDSTVADQQQHDAPAAAAGAAQAAAVSPANERGSMAEAGQVNEMEQQEPGVFDAASFKAMLMDAIKKILPENNDEADKFAESGKVDQVKDQATSKVKSEKESAAGNIEQKTQETPDPGSVPERKVKPLVPQNPGPPPKDVQAAKAMPGKRGDAEVNTPLEQNVAEVDQTMAAAEVTDEQLQRSNEPAFTSALDSKNSAKKHAQEAPGHFRQQEAQTLAAGETSAQATGETQLAAMHQERTGIMAKVAADQQKTVTRDTSARQKVADQINKLFEQTKTDVDTILTNLDTSVETMFDQAAARATRAFEDLVDKRMSAYKRKRYSGLIGKGRWLKDLFAGLPDEVNAFFTEGRNLYLNIMDGELTIIAEHVANELTAAKDRIQKGKQDIQNYVMSLPKNLQQVGKQAADDINSKFDELTDNVNSKGEELVDTIADMYQESLENVDARIEEMKAANRGLIDMALGALIGVIETIIKIKNLLFNLLVAALEAIGAIIMDPIGFLSNLIDGVKLGIENFFANILNNVMTGLIEWLTGSLGEVGIQIPDNLFSLSGIFDLVTQMLGLTWDYFRQKAVKLLGEPMVAAMETGFELFQIVRKEGVAGLWEHLKEQFTDLKEVVMDAIRDLIVSKVIDAGIKWILGLLNPAGAFIKACMLIIDIVKFFVERAAQIFELVQAFIDAIKAIANGGVGAVAKAIERALIKAIPVLIGFLAALVGVTGLTSKVQKIVKKIRKRIDKAINKIIKKAKKGFKKLVKTGKAKVKGAVAGILNWLGIKKTFKGDDGEEHKLYFKKGSKPMLIVESDPINIDKLIAENLPKAKGKQKDDLLAAKAKKKALVAYIEEHTEDKGKKDQKTNTKKLEKHISDELGAIGGLLKSVMVNPDLPLTKVTYAMKAGMAFKVTADPLTILSGNTKGSAPETGVDLVGWDLITLFDEDDVIVKKDGQVIIEDGVPKTRRMPINWVRFHLLSEKLHGPGKKWNLVPADKTDNSNYESTIEKKLKNKLNHTNIMYFDVEVTGYHGGIPSNQDTTKLHAEQPEAYQKYNEWYKGIPTELKINAGYKDGDKIFKNKKFQFSGNINVTVEPGKKDIVMSKVGEATLVRYGLNTWPARKIAAMGRSLTVVDLVNNFFGDKEQVHVKTVLGYLDEIIAFLKVESEGTTRSFSEGQSNDTVIQALELKKTALNTIRSRYNHEAAMALFLQKGIKTNAVKDHFATLGGFVDLNIDNLGINFKIKYPGGGTIKYVLNQTNPRPLKGGEPQYYVLMKELEKL